MPGINKKGWWWVFSVLKAIVEHISSLVRDCKASDSKVGVAGGNDVGTSGAPGIFGAKYFAPKNKENPPAQRGNPLKHNNALELLGIILNTL